MKQRIKLKNILSVRSQYIEHKDSDESSELDMLIDAARRCSHDTLTPWSQGVELEEDRDASIFVFDSQTRNLYDIVNEESKAPPNETQRRPLIRAMKKHMKPSKMLSCCLQIPEEKKESLVLDKTMDITDTTYNSVLEHRSTLYELNIIDSDSTLYEV